MFFCTLSLQVKGQNFIDGTFTYNNVEYSVLTDSSSFVMVYNMSNPPIIQRKGLERIRLINHNQLKNSVILAIKSNLTPQQITSIQQEKGLSISFFINSLGEIYAIEKIDIEYSTCIVPNNIYAIENTLKNIMVTFSDGRPPEAGWISVTILGKMFR